MVRQIRPVFPNWCYMRSFCEQVRAALVSLLLLTVGGVWPQSSWADEGMFPMSELAQIDLSARGIELSADQLYNANGVSLVDGICRVNGCTGSFISSAGLIITNHHCAYDAIQQASSLERDLLKDGFQAKMRADEIPAPGYVVRITEDYQDVSQQVLQVVQPGMDFLERTQSIQKRCRELEKQAELQHPGLRAEVAEMFTGKSYVLFLYTFLKDVRLVFAPPASVGNFGGEVDNWEWPRHTGDFSLMRAYTAADGSSANFDPANIPYKPKRVVRVNPAGVNEGDTVFLLGYPGRTARHKTASFIQYEAEVRLPITVESFAWQIEQMTKAGLDDREVEIKMSARIKSLANVEKRSRGQLQGLQRANIFAARQAEEQQLQSFIDSDPARRQRYGHVLKEIANTYNEIRTTTGLDFYMDQLRSSSRTASAAYFLIDASIERAKADVDRELAYLDKNFQQSTQTVLNGLRDFHAPTETLLLEGILDSLKTQSNWQSLQAIRELVSEPEMIERIISTTRLAETTRFEELLKLNYQQLVEVDDPMLQLMRQLYPYYAQARKLAKQREGRLNELYGLLLEVKPQFLQSKFIPDANGTLRLTLGKVRAYSPVDALIKTPVSTFKGVVEKTTGKDPFVTPEIMMQKWKSREFGTFEHPLLKDIPVAILYDTDTTGGNSGSPVFNSKGELVGVNFDRCFEATINDFAWNTNYSRSIGVDIRYVLWIVSTVYGATHLKDELSN
jgi:Peptidase S46